MNCKECVKRRCPSFGASGNCNVCLYTGGDYLEVRDWLSDINIPPVGEPFDMVEVRFKSGRKDFYRNANRLPLSVGDIVAVESSPGHDIGCVMLTGELVRLQMRRKKADTQSPEIKKIYRVATQKDIDLWQTAISREKKTLVRTREICDNLGLVMKLSDVEYQGDNLKATFFYTAEGRVDFRLLIKELAGAFGVRVEMRQIGLRQEAARVGSIGSCGRELCCTTWLTDFRSVNTSAARTQRLSLNPQKLAGQCGKLKCCLNFELDVYIDALKGFPQTDQPLRTEKGMAFFQKMDVFKGIFWYAYDFEVMNWIGLRVDAVAEIQRLNRRGEKAESLEIYIEQEESKPKEHRPETSELKAVEEGELTRFDRRPDRGGDRRQRRDGERRQDGRRDGRNTQRDGAEGQDAGHENGTQSRNDSRDNNRRRDDRRDNRPQRQGAESAEGISQQESDRRDGRPDNRNDSRGNNRRRDDRRDNRNVQQDNRSQKQDAEPAEGVSQQDKGRFGNRNDSRDNRRRDERRGNRRRDDRRDDRNGRQGDRPQGQGEGASQSRGDSRDNDRRNNRDNGSKGRGGDGQKENPTNE